MSEHRNENMSGADLDGDDLSSDDYEGADLSGAILTNTTLTNTSFRGADLTGADLTDATTGNTDLSGANLTMANLTNVNLAACNTDGTIFDFADLTGADTTGIDPARFLVAFGTAAGTVAQGNDARFTDARTPVSHTHAGTDIASGSIDAARMTGVLASSDLTNDAALEKTANKAAASGYASLDGSSKVVQDPANATDTPTASKIVIADASGKVDGWVSDAAAGVKGLVDLNSVALTGDARLGTHIRAQERFFRSPLPNSSGSMFLESGYGYFVFIGVFLEAITLNYVNVHVSTAGAGSQTAEVGLFSTPYAPNRTGQTLTRLAATSGMTDMTAAGYHRNSTPLAYSPTVGVPVWAAIRTVMGTTRVLVRGVSFEMGQGAAFLKSAVGDLTSVSPVACSVQGHSTSSVGPDLWVTID